MVNITTKAGAWTRASVAIGLTGILGLGGGCDSPAEPTEDGSAEGSGASESEIQGADSYDTPQAATEDEATERSASTEDTEDAIAAIDKFIAEQDIDTARSNWRTRLPKPPEVDFDPSRTCYWELTTNKGPIKIKLFPEVAPMHVSSTIYLTRLGFYDGLTFHRVIPGFMAQGGCPLGTGRGDPGYEYDGEFDPSVRHDRPGLLSMANAGPGTDGSQFFLTFVATPHLDDKHTIFGEVVEGQETMEMLEAAGSPSGRTTEPPSIEKATVSSE